MGRKKQKKTIDGRKNVKRKNRPHHETQKEMNHKRKPINGIT